jgi:hypothetical protein
VVAVDRREVVRMGPPVLSWDVREREGVEDVGGSVGHLDIMPARNDVDVRFGSVPSVVEGRMAEKGKGRKALTATAVSLAVSALQNEEVQRRLKAAGADAVGRMRDWNREHGPQLRDPATFTGAARRATRQGRLESRLSRLHDAEEALRAAGQSGPRIDWLTQTLAEADTTLAIAGSLPRDKRRQAQDTVDASLREIEEALFAAVHPGQMPSGD